MSIKFNTYRYENSKRKQLETRLTLKTIKFYK